jgi:hypothetical protein
VSKVWETVAACAGGYGTAAGGGVVAWWWPWLAPCLSPREAARRWRAARTRAAFIKIMQDNGMSHLGGED